MTAHRLLIVLLSILVAFPPALLANLPDKDPSRAAFNTEMERVDKLMTFASEMEKASNWSAHDFEAVLNDAEYESSELISFVKESIDFELYKGVLRGAFGTLLSQAGNSLDQSILLAKVLRDAGYDARIVRTSLERSQAMQVLEELRRATTPAHPMGEPDAIINALQNFGIFPQLDATQRSAIVSEMNRPQRPEKRTEYAQVIETSRFITDSLSRENIKLEARDQLAELLNEARDYFWVEYKDSSAGGWTAIHPVFRDKSPFPELSWTEVYVDTIPAELQHRIRFQVFIERKKGNQLESVAIMDPWERPVANLVDRPVTFANISDSMMAGGDTAFNLDRAAESASYFAPGFMDGMAPGAKYFDLNGNLIDPMVAGAPGAGVFKQIGRAFSAATGEIGGKDSLPVLTAQWMEFTLIEPGGHEHSFRRTTFDSIGPDARSSGDFSNVLDTNRQQARALLKRHTFMTQTGKVSKAFASAFGAQRLLGSRGAFEALLRQQYAQPAQSSMKAGSVEDISGDWLGHLSLFSVFDLADALSDSHRVYRSGPALVIQSEGLSENGLSAAIDIVTNPRRAIRIDDRFPEQDPSILVQAGVWETIFEGSVLPQGRKKLNTWTAFEEARKNGVPTAVVTEASQLLQLDVSPDTKFAIKTDLDRGYVVLVPKREGKTLTSGWWRVDPGTGLTLGQIGDGRGAQFVDYLTLGITFGFVAYGTVGCAEADAQGASSAATGCCMGANALFAVAGLALGIAVGSAATMWQTIAMSAGVDVGTAFVSGPIATKVCTAAIEAVSD